MRMHHYRCDTYVGKHGEITFVVYIHGSFLNWFSRVYFSFWLDCTDNANTKDVVEFIVRHVCETGKVSNDKGYWNISGWTSFYRAKKAYEIVKLELDNPTISVS